MGVGQDLGVDCDGVGGLRLVAVVLGPEGGHAVDVDLELGSLRVAHVDSVDERRGRLGTPDVHRVVCQAEVVGAEDDAGGVGAIGDGEGGIEGEVIHNRGIEIELGGADPFGAFPGTHRAVGEAADEGGLLALEFLAVLVGNGDGPGVASPGHKGVALVSDVLRVGLLLDARVPDGCAGVVGDLDLIGLLFGTRLIGVDLP